ncbi:MAG: helix-hairpin-helix domain-containing protein [Candidatus Pseudobacter hemicellulosilyticus]|uniref:Helix-hairpin-helix domain-containing protein n=1 Tax=Candidatus Pseudobacter hemicellulosilyticus TaxID=3121375 RepID=A0AAJ6BH14_9BACT|nr:MAG: helix-hairpin-helix domain-containing protein [Pseudobacter sp.]
MREKLIMEALGHNLLRHSKKGLDQGQFIIETFGPYPERLYRRVWNRKLLTMGCLLLALAVQAQVESSVMEEQLENSLVSEERVWEEENWWEELAQLRRCPLPLNRIDPEALQVFPFLSPAQVQAFARYRQLLGPLISLYELQAVPGWDLALIRQLLPYVYIGAQLPAATGLFSRFSAGEHSLELRYAGQPSRDQPAYMGNAAAMGLRYTYRYQQELQWGIRGDKDAGEPFFRQRQRAGFDFYSAHFFARQLGRVKALALGDYTVNLGQGLIHWQSLSFRKSGQVLGIQKPAGVLKPYRSAGEFNFLRGAGITLEKGRYQLTVFGSRRLLSASPEQDSSGSFLRSIQVNGLHRSIAELERRNNSRWWMAGASFQAKGRGWQWGLNWVQHQFASPLQETAQPYNLFAMAGSRWNNASIDYQYNFAGLHGFGELAVDQRGHWASLQGLLFHPDPMVGVALLYRRLPAQYQSFLGRAFTENVVPSNESGWYAGIVVRPAPGWQLDVYADVFRFPWLRYRVDAPGQGSDYLLQLTCQPSRAVTLSMRYRAEQKPANDSSGLAVLLPVVPMNRQHWRSEWRYQWKPGCQLRSRLEMVWVRNTQTGVIEKGYAGFMEVQKQQSSRLWWELRWVLFETDSYAARLFAYEPAAMNGFTVSSFYQGGIRYYLNLRYDLLSTAKGKSRRGLQMEWRITIAGNMCSGPAFQRRTVTKMQEPLSWQTQLILFKK